MNGKKNEVQSKADQGLVPLVVPPVKHEWLSSLSRCVEGWSSGTTLHSIITALNIVGVPLREIHWSALASAEILFAKGQMAVARVGSIATCLCSKKYNACSSQCVPGRARIAAMPPSFPCLSLSASSLPGAFDSAGNLHFVLLVV